MPSDKSVRFGWFVRWKYLSMRLRPKDFAAEVGVTPRRILQIVNHAVTIEDVPEGMGHMLAGALGMTYSQLERESASTPVPRPRLKNTRAGARSKGPKVDVLLVSEHGDAIRDDKQGQSRGPGRRRKRAKKP